MRTVAYKFLDDNLVIIYIINEYGIVRKYVARESSHRLERLAKVISRMYSENKERIVFNIDTGFDLSFGVL